MSAALIFATAAWAHDADVIYVQLDEAGAQLQEVVTLTAGTLSQLAPVDADGDGALSQADLEARADAIGAGVWDQIPIEGSTRCARAGERAILRDGYVELGARFTCPPGPLSQEFRILSVLTTNYRIVLGRQVDGDAGRAFAQGNVQRLVIRPAEGTASGPAPGFAGGLGSLLSAPGVTLIWLWALLLAPSVAAAGARLIAVWAPGALVALALPGGSIPAAVPVVLGLATGFVALVPRSQRWILPGLGLLSAVEAAGAGNRGFQFQLGRGSALLVAALVLVPVLRILARRPALKQRAALALLCAAIFSFGFSGFSLIQSAGAF